MSVSTLHIEMHTQTRPEKRIWFCHKMPIISTCASIHGFYESGEMLRKHLDLFSFVVEELL